ncbi:MAG: hypothetical protein NTW74_15915 [Acidobacteria bacterium]|nr:hypothetical protein [Acidobacteriota bacterium]
MAAGHKIVFVLGITIMLTADALLILFGEVSTGMLYSQVFMLAVPAFVCSVQEMVKK